jgi:hypothetical protein
MALNYFSITPARVSAADKKPGHSDLVYFALHAEATSWAIPTPTVVPGSSKKITSAHTFPTDKGFFSIQAKASSIEPTADAAGERGGQVATYKTKVIIKGDDAVINEFVENILNEDLVFIFNDPVCGVDRFVQLGSRCTPANIEGFAFRGGSKGAGGFKEYEFVVASPDKFFYEGAVTMATETNLAVAPLTMVEDITSGGLKITVMPNDIAATGTELQRSTMLNMSSPTNVTGASNVYTQTGLAADADYYFRARNTAGAAGILKGPWTAVFSVKTNPI